MGRPAKTPEQHALEGTRVRPTRVSVVASGRPRIPSHLSKVERAEFKRCVQLLEKRGTVTPGDLTALAVYAAIYARWVQAKRELGVDIMVETTVMDNSGAAHQVRRVNPLVKIVSDAERQILAMTRALGLTPDTREKIRPAAPDPNPRDEVIPGSCADLMPELVKEFHR